MKRFYVLFAVVFLLLASGTGWAIDVKVKGNAQYTFGYLRNGYGYNLQNQEQVSGIDDKKSTSDPFWATQRIRVQVDFVASKDLWSRLYFAIGKLNWGNPNAKSGAPLDADMVNIRLKMAFMHWRVPNTDLDIRMGIQRIGLPQAVGRNPVFDNYIPGISWTYKINESVGLTGFWVRPFDEMIQDNTAYNLDDEMDMFGLTLPVKLDGMEITPWAAYARIGNDSGYWRYLVDESNPGGARKKYGWDRWGSAVADFIDGDRTSPNPYGSGGNSMAWWAGMAFTLNMFDPWTFKFDGMYGALHGDKDAPDSRGWWLDASLDYKLDWAVPGVFGWYSTGDDSDIDKDRSGRVPTIALDDGFEISGFGFNGPYGLRGGKAAFVTGIGTWGIGLQLDKVTFVPNLSHTLRLMYISGTNSVGAARYKQTDSNFTGIDFNGFYLTNRDRYYEVNFDHYYQIYDTWTVGLELGYIKLDLDSDVWNSPWDQTSSGWKVMTTFKWTF